MSLSNSRLFDPNLNNRVVFGTPGPQGPQGPPGPGSSPMTPFVEGTAFGETSVGRTLLGYGVDAGSNNIGLWCSSTGSPQPASNSSSSITAFFDTDVDSATLLNGIYLGQGGSITGSNLSNSLFTQRNSNVENMAGWTDNIMTLNNFTANPNDSITHSIVVMQGQFVSDSQFNQSLLIGDMTRLEGSGVTDALVIRTPGPFGTITMANNSGYIGNGQVTQVLDPGDLMVETFDRYFLKTLRSDNTSGQIAYYEPGSGELTYGPEPVPYTLPTKQPTTAGGQFGINSAANGSEVNGSNSFNNYSAGPAQLTGVTAMGQQLYQASTPGANTFTNDIFLGRSHQFPSATSIQNSLIAASIVGNAGISKILDCNMIVPRASSLTFGYVGEINGANFHSSGSVACTTDPVYASVFSSGGTVNPGATNLVCSSAPAANSIIMQGQGNTLIQSSSSAVTYNFPVFSNCCAINSGTIITLPDANSQLSSNHSSFRMPNILTVATSNNSTAPLAFNSVTGRISPTLSSLLSRVYRNIGVTNAAGQAVFTPGGGINPSTVGIVFTATIRNASTTISYNAQVINVNATQIIVQVFNSVLVVTGASMVPSGAGILVHFTMEY